MCTKNIYCETYLLNTCFSAQYYCLLWVLHRMVDLWKLLSLDFYSVIVCVQLSGCNSLTTESSYPSLSPGVYSNSCSLSQWCSLTISSSAAPFSFCLQSFPESGSFPMSQLFASGGQNIGASASVLPISIQGWFTLGFKGWILLFKGLSRVSSLQFESINSSTLILLYGSPLTSVHDYWKNHSFDYVDLCWQSDVSTLILSLGLS